MFLVARQLGELLDEVDGFLRVVRIHHLDGEPGVHQHEVADVRLRREVEGYVARDAEDVHRSQTVVLHFSHFCRYG